jgi:hypothetical protein
MAEWSMAAVLKTVSPKGDVGSNPTPSARKFAQQILLVAYGFWQKEPDYSSLFTIHSLSV